MKELFDRHQQKLTEAEDRKIWGALHDATRSKARFWKRVAIPVSALATTAAAAAVIVMVNQAPSVSERVAQKEFAQLSDLEKDLQQDLDGLANLREQVMEAGAKEDDFRKDGDANVLTENSAEGFEPMNRVGGRPERRLSPPSPVAVKMEEIPGGSERKNNETADLSEAAQRLSSTKSKGLQEKELERPPVDTFAEGGGLKAGVVSEADDLYFRGGRTGEVGSRVDDIPTNDESDLNKQSKPGRRSPGADAPKGRDVAFADPATPRSEPEEVIGDDRARGLGRIEARNKKLIKSRAKKPGPPRRDPISVGGTAPVNGRAIDAMFFQNYGVNPFVDPEDDRFATFSVDVDNASYALSRAYLNRGVLPPAEAVRVEEFLNSFKHNYAAPRHPMFADREWAPSEKGTFAIHLDAAPSPFGKGLVMMRVGLKGREVFEEERKPANLTFVVDVSGSMRRENRLGLVKQSLFTLLDGLNAEDQVSLVVYGSTARVLLPPTSLVNRRLIESAIARLHPEGATNAEAGLRKGYAMAERAYESGYINRVILCSDGVANVGKTGADEILEVIKRQAGEGIYLTAVGFGMGNYNDVLLEKLANQGDGNYYYVDTPKEARKVFLENLTGTLQTIAGQVKIQVEFDPESVRRYRLLGYENRAVADRDFRNNRIDAGEVGAGHEVTALFEMKLNKNVRRGNLATVRIRYQDPETGRVTEETRVLRTDDVARGLQDTDPSFRMDAAVAEFAEILRHSYWAKDGDLSQVFSLAQDASRELERPQDLKEMVNLVEQAWQLWPREAKGWSYEVRPSWDPDDDN